MGTGRPRHRRDDRLTRAAHASVPVWRLPPCGRGKNCHEGSATKTGDCGVFGQMDELVFGRPAAQAVADLARRAGTDRIFLMACGTPNQETEEVVTAMATSRPRHA